MVDHPELSWDDYEKDYSDLPPEELRRHHERAALEKLGLAEQWAGEAGEGELEPE